MAREPILNAPPAVGRVIVLLAAIYLIQMLLPAQWQAWVINAGAFNPARYAELPQGASVFYEGPDGIRFAIETHFPGQPVTDVTSIITYGFLHGSLIHLGFNLIWLLAFGTPVARYLGEARFYGFMLASVAVGAITYFFFNINSAAPMIGASGAVSALMGAAIRILFAPVHAVFQNGRLVGAQRQGLAAFNDNRLLGFAGIWILLNLIFGLASGGGATAIAWEAHLGGFLFGLFGFRFFLPKPPAPPV